MRAKTELTNTRKELDVTKCKLNMSEKAAAYYYVKGTFDLNTLITLICCM